MLLQSSLTLCDSTDCSAPGSSVCGVLQARILEWVAMPCSRSSPPRDWTLISGSSCTAGRFFTPSHPHILSCIINMCLYIYIYIGNILFIHSSINVYWGCCHLLAMVNNVVMNMGMQILLKTWVFLILLNIYPEVKWLDHIIIQFLIFFNFWGTAILLSIAPVQFCIPTNSA